jgi:hypothetical protein
VAGCGGALACSEAPIRMMRPMHGREPAGYRGPTGAVESQQGSEISPAEQVRFAGVCCGGDGPSRREWDILAR